MPESSNRLSRFWQELKRRRVIHVITVYATSAFVIIELVGNLAEPLNLPGRLPTIIIIILAAGFPLAVILSWLYDLTSEGVEKTKPLSEIEDGDKRAIPNAWKIATYVSFVVIIGLVVLNVMGGSKQLRAGEIQSMVILPFGNFSGDVQLDRYVDGLHAKLIGDMQQISGWDVLNRTSSYAYKDVDMRVHDIALELDADAVVETEVMCLGDSICIQIKVISGFPEERTLWIADYKEAKSQMPNLNNRITKQIAEEVKIELTSDEDLKLAEKRTVDPEAFDAYINGLSYLEMVNTDSLQKATDYFTTAIEKEQDWAPPYAGLAEVWAYQQQMGFVPPSIAIPKIYQNLNKVHELDHNSAISHYIIAVIAVWTEWDWEKGEAEFLKSLELNPSNALCRMFYAHLLMILHRYDEALTQAEEAVRMDPHRPLILALHSVVLMNAGDYDLAKSQVKKAHSLKPDHYFVKRRLHEVYLLEGDHKKAFELYLDGKKFMFDGVTIAELLRTFDEQGHHAALEKVINEHIKAGRDRYAPDLGGIYAELEKYDEAIICLEKAYEMRKPSMPYLSIGNRPDSIRKDPRFIKLLEKMNLPKPED